MLQELMDLYWIIAKGEDISTRSNAYILKRILLGTQYSAYQCEICGIFFETGTRLTAHKLDVDHNNVKHFAINFLEQRVGCLKYFVCPVNCGNKFQSIQDIIGHMILMHSYMELLKVGANRNYLKRMYAQFSTLTFEELVLVNQNYLIS
jgi:hypothetical protein